MCQHNAKKMSFAFRKTGPFGYGAMHYFDLCFLNQADLMCRGLRLNLIFFY